jgi:cytochrome P450
MDNVNVSDMLVHFLALGALMSTVTSAALYFNHAYNSDSILPFVSFQQCYYTSISSLVLLLFSVLYWIDRRKLLRLKIPHVPSSVPYLGHAIRFVVHSPWDSMLQWHKQYGEIVAFPLMGRTMITLSSPNHLKVALQSKIHAVKKDVGFTYQPFMVILGKGIVTSEDKAWMKQRLKMSTALRINVLEIIPLITLKAVQRLMEKFDRAIDTNDPVNLTEALRHLTLQVISNSFLSISFDESDSSFGKLYLPIVEECNQRVYHPYRAACIFLPFWWRHWYRVSNLNQYVSSLVQNRWEERKVSCRRQNDILDLVLDAYEKENKSQSKIPKEDLCQLRDEFKTFMLAGHETSAAMMTWALYEMIAKKSLADEVANESKSIFNINTDWATTDELPSLENLSNLVFAESCLKVCPFFKSWC